MYVYVYRDIIVSTSIYYIHFNAVMTFFVNELEILYTNISHPTPSSLPDDPRRMAHGSPEPQQAQFTLQQKLPSRCLQSYRHLPLRRGDEPIADGHSQVFYWSPQATLPGCVQTWLDQDQLHSGGLCWELQLQRRHQAEQRGQVNIAGLIKVLLALPYRPLWF